MEIKKHFESYRASVITDALDGFAEFAKTIVADDGVVFHTHLRKIVEDITGSIAIGKEDIYFSNLRRHQQSTLTLFKNLVEREISKSQKAREVAVLDLAHSKSMKWLKFSNLVITFDKFILIPRFDDKFGFRDADRPVITADELDIVLCTKSKTLAQEALTGKLAQQAHGEFCKIVAWVPQGFEWHDVNKINQNIVLDWTMPLEVKNEKRKSIQRKTRSKPQGTTTGNPLH